MAWLAVDKDGTETLFRFKPERLKRKKHVLRNTMPIMNPQGIIVKDNYEALEIVDACRWGYSEDMNNFIKMCERVGLIGYDKSFGKSYCKVLQKGSIKHMYGFDLTYDDEPIKI